MNAHLMVAARKLQGIGVKTTFVSLFMMAALSLPAQSKGNWICEETTYYSIYEDISLTESKRTSNTKTLKWIDANTIGIESILLNRIDPNSETFFNQRSGSSVFINSAERPHIVVFTQPQVWMNKFGNLRVRFYRCKP